MSVDIEKDSGKKLFRLWITSKHFIFAIGFCFDWPWGMNLLSGRYSCAGLCWSWVETSSAFIEYKALWVGPFSVAFGKKEWIHA